jgi:hypothetical protein
MILQSKFVVAAAVLHAGTQSVAGQTSCPSGEKLMKVSIVTDYDPDETTWTLRNTVTGASEMEGGPYDDCVTLYEAETCLPCAPYEFEIFDDYGDGLEIGVGSYTVEYGGVNLASGEGEFDCELVPLPVVCPTVSPSVAPTETKASKTFRAPKSGKRGDYGINDITSQQLESIQKENKSILSFLIAGTVIVAAAAFLNIALNLKWAQKSRQARSINHLDEEEEEEAVDGFEDESNEQLRDVVDGEGVEIVEVETH